MFWCVFLFFLAIVNSAPVLVDIKMDSGILERLRSLKIDRDDIEEVNSEHVVVWADPTRVEALKAAFKGSDMMVNAPDHNRIRATLEKARSQNYNHSDVILRRTEPDWTVYCGHSCMMERMQAMATDCASSMTLTSIGRSIQGRDIWVMRVSNLPDGAANKVLLAGNIHGDEVAGGQLLQRMMWEMCYQPDQVLDHILNTVITYFMPMFNPDGYTSIRRENANRVDLNRDFPNRFNGDHDSEMGRQAETTIYMDFTAQHDFVLSLMMHGGAEVVNYPYDSCDPGSRTCRTGNPSLSHKNDEAIEKALIYSTQNQPMYNGVWDRGIVNGAAWYVIWGSLQDFCLDYRNQLDLTIEVSNVKWPLGADLPRLYTDNRGSLTEFVLSAV